MVLDYEPGRFSQREEIPPAALACQRQARLLRAEVGRCARKQLSRTRDRKYRPCERQKPAPTVAKANKRLASRFYQLKMGHCLTGPVSGLDNPPTGRHLLVVPVPGPGTTCSNTVPNGRTSYGTPSQQRPASSLDPPGSGAKPASRNCSPISGAVRRS